MSVKVINTEENQSLLNELAEFDIDTSKLHLVVLVDDSAKLLNNVGLKVSLAINYIVVYH